MISELHHPTTARELPKSGELVCLVDNDEAVLRSLERLFRSARLKVAAFASAGDFLAHGEHAGPTCLVLDMQMPGIDGLALQAVLANRGEQIVFLTGHADVPTCAKAMKAGAVDFLTKPVDEETLLSAVACALDRARETCRLRVEQESARTVIASLTQRELEVMRGVVSGLLNKQIAAQLGIAEKTVKIHRGRVMRKTRCMSVPDLVRLVQHAESSSFFPPEHS